MFSEPKKNRVVTAFEGQPNRIGKSTKIKGDLISEADFRIDGTLEGTIKTTGKVVIGKEGQVSGKVECIHADIEGKFNGELFVKDLLSLKASAVIEGTIIVGKLAVEPGSIFNASCTMNRGVLSTVSEATPKLHATRLHETAKVS